MVLYLCQLSLVVRISHERGDFCRRVAVDFVRKTVYLKQGNRRGWLESYTVTAAPRSQLPFIDFCQLTLLGKPPAVFKLCQK